MLEPSSDERLRERERDIERKKERRSGWRERGEGELGKMDAEMEIETESTPGSIHGNDNVMSLIELARQLITQGKPTLALQAVCIHSLSCSSSFPPNDSI